ncbi:9effb1a1-46ac-418b-845d-27a2c489f271 [Sclerotinia trifoliorum]|uniref:9effb1a1-46ac-418b-845d-27a2c489f271 n=1 Tax=Sclerotinia trifoliorum TaxID=28548 RepID=A0A8H2ZR16_9HELO|nr:9effb1a1-46ac-418b-845d-27a2c489f271 [Sclerotinia trifoliorum]
MDKFWAQAAKALKPGGTVALWTRGSTLSSFYPHPSTPNRDRLLEIFKNFEQKILAPYELPPNRLSRDMYDNLPLPWNIPHPIPSSTFPPSQFLKLNFDRDGILSDATSNDFFGGGREVTLTEAEEALGTANMVTRWREAHPEKAGTEKDILKLHVGEVRKVMGGRESMLVGSSTAIIFVKKALEEA